MATHQLLRVINSVEGREDVHVFNLEFITVMAWFY